MNWSNTSTMEILVDVAVLAAIVCFVSWFVYAIWRTAIALIVVVATYIGAYSAAALYLLVRFIKWAWED